MLPADVSRCLGVSGETTDARKCPHRGDCERHNAWNVGGCGRVVATLWACETEGFESRIPRPCAGRTTRLSARPHPLCRGCTRWQYGITDGITPEFMDSDGVATCADRVVLHQTNVGDGERLCAPAR